MDEQSFLRTLIAKASEEGISAKMEAVTMVEEIIFGRG